MFRKVDIANIVSESTTDGEYKEYKPGKCALCGKETLTDQFGFCENCGDRLVRLDNVPLLTIVPIPTLPIDVIKIPEAFRNAAHAFKETLNKE